MEQRENVPAFFAVRQRCKSRAGPAFSHNTPCVRSRLHSVCDSILSPPATLPKPPSPGAPRASPAPGIGNRNFLPGKSLRRRHPSGANALTPIHHDETLSAHQTGSENPLRPATAPAPGIYRFAGPVAASKLISQGVRSRTRRPPFRRCARDARKRAQYRSDAQDSRDVQRSFRMLTFGGYSVRTS